MHDLKTPLNFSVLWMSVCNNHLATMDCNMYCKHEHVIFTWLKPTFRGHPLQHSLNWTEFPSHSILTASSCHTSQRGHATTVVRHPVSSKSTNGSSTHSTEYNSQHTPPIELHSKGTTLGISLLWGESQACEWDVLCFLLMSWFLQLAQVHHVQGVPPPPLPSSSPVVGNCSPWLESAEWRRICLFAADC